MKRKVLLMLVSLMTVCNVTACGKQTNSSTANEKNYAVVGEESLQTDISNNEIAVRMEDFSVGGYEISLPCTVGDFIEKFELEYSFPMSDLPNTICCSYLIDGEPAGVIFVYCEEARVHDTDYIYAMNVDEYSIVKERPFSVDISGITEDMTREQIREIWGEPSFSGNRSITYCDGEYEDSQYINKIIFGFDDTSGKISDISFFVNLDRIEEQEDK